MARRFFKKAAVTATGPNVSEFAVPAVKSGANQTIKATPKQPANLGDGTYHLAIILHSAERGLPRGRDHLPGGQYHSGKDVKRTVAQTPGAACVPGA
jgi:hypothetical protein